MKLKKILGITGLAVASTVALAACGAGGNKSAKDDKTLTVGIMTLDDTTEPLWDKVKELAKDKGVTIELKEFTDYNQPNEALKNGEIACRLFGLLGRRDDYVIPWEQVRRVGADIILIESELDKTRCPRRKKEFF